MCDCRRQAPFAERSAELSIHERVLSRACQWWSAGWQIRPASRGSAGQSRAARQFVQVQGIGIHVPDVVITTRLVPIACEKEEPSVG